MSTTFIVTLVLCTVVIVFWRVALVILLAVALALLLSGLNTVAQAIDGQHGRPSTEAPAQPGTSPDAPGKALGDAPDGPPAPNH